MSNDMHYLRVKRGDVELEIRSSAETVAGAWADLSRQVSESFALRRTSYGGALQGASDESVPENDSFATEPMVEAKSKKPRQRSRRRPAQGNSAASDERANVADITANAPIDSFPDLGEKPSALYIGYALLRWMRDKHSVDGLTAGEIQSFATSRLRRTNTRDAYRIAFRRQPRAVDATGTPLVYRLMAPGERALETYLSKVAEGATSDEASEAGNMAEVEAEEAAR